MKRNKPKFRMAYDDQGRYICDYMIVDMGKGRSAVLPITQRLRSYYRKLCCKWFCGERKEVWRGWRGDQLRGLVSARGELQERSFYAVMKPVIDGARRGEQVRVLKRIGALKKPKTL